MSLARASTNLWTRDYALSMQLCYLGVLRRHSRMRNAKRTRGVTKNGVYCTLEELLRRPSE